MPWEPFKYQLPAIDMHLGVLLPLQLIRLGVNHCKILKLVSAQHCCPGRKVET